MTELPTIQAKRTSSHIDVTEVKDRDGLEAGARRVGTSLSPKKTKN
jgi:hypothetical protein